KEIAKQFSEFFQTDSTQKTEKKTSFWKKLFH
ncbi:Glycogen synthase, partial [human gut metagenome]